MPVTVYVCYTIRNILVLEVVVEFESAAVVVVQSPDVQTASATILVDHGPAHGPPQCQDVDPVPIFYHDVAAFNEFPRK